MYANANNLASMMLRRTLGGGDPILALFANGAQGADYDPSDSSTVFKEAAMTTPAGDGDPAGAIMDKSGNGNHATQSTAASRGQRSGSAIVYDGFDDAFEFPLTAHGAVSSGNTFIAAISVDAGSSGFERLISPNAVTGFIVQIRDGLLRLLVEQQSTGFVIKQGTTDVRGSGFVIVTARYDRAGLSVSTRVNGAEEGVVTGAVSNNDKLFSGGATKYILGGGVAAPEKFDGSIGRSVFVDAALSDAEVSEIESYLAGRCGVSL